MFSVKLVYIRILGEFMDFVGLTIFILQFLKNVVGNWGLAIIALTIIVRLAMWHSSVSQQRSMRVMQALQPKMKMIQDRYKSDPQTMQRKMAEFYKEHQFNPMGGCLPMLIQIPIFILLYTALISPQFIAAAGKSNFLFIDRLDATIKSNAGVSFDGKFQVGPRDNFQAGKEAKVYLKSGEVLDSVKVKQPMKAVEVQGDIVPGENLDLKIALDNLNLKFAELNGIEKAEIDILDISTRETEKVEFTRNGDILMASVPTAVVAGAIHYDVIFLIILFAITMWISQKVMMAQNKNQPQDPTQQAIQKSMGTIMPVMIMVTFVFIPIPAGVLLYLVTSNIFQIVQTVIINKKLDKEDETKKAAKQGSNKDIDTKASMDSKIIEVKDAKDVEDK